MPSTAPRHWGTLKACSNIECRHLHLVETLYNYGGPGGRAMRRWRLDDNDVQMDENGVLCDDIDATIAMCNELSDNHDVQCDASVAM